MPLSGVAALEFTPDFRPLRFVPFVSLISGRPPISSQYSCRISVAVLLDQHQSRVCGANDQKVSQIILGLPRPVLLVLVALPFHVVFESALVLLATRTIRLSVRPHTRVLLKRWDRIFSTTYLPRSFSGCGARQMGRKRCAHWSGSSSPSESSSSTSSTSSVFAVRGGISSSPEDVPWSLRAATHASVNAHWYVLRLKGRTHAAYWVGVGVCDDGVEIASRRSRIIEEAQLMRRAI
jgi:hypothetical protein